MSTENLSESTHQVHTNIDFSTVEPLEKVNVGVAELTAEQKLAELEKLLPELANVARISEKMYRWQLAHDGMVPPIAWEELRVALSLPPEPEKSRIIRSTILPPKPRISR